MLECEFFSYKAKDASLLPLPYTNQTEGSVGLFHGSFIKEDSDKTSPSCQRYPTDFFDTDKDDKYDYDIMFTLAQLSALLAPIMGLLAWVLCLLDWCCCSTRRSCCLYWFTFSLLFLAFAFQGLTFMLYGETSFWYVLLTT